ncbi:MAG: energy transducer TonB [Proteobacteria bacterium]|nr:energy transducer TonB [Pseudomonadota bacterium]
MKPASLARWSLCFTAALGIHVGAAAALMARWSNDVDQLANAPVIMLDLAPVAVAPETTPTEVPPDSVAREMQTGVEQTPDKPEEVVEKAEPLPEPEKPVEQAKAEAEPEKPVDVKPAPQPELSTLPPPRPVEKTEDKPDEKKKEVKRKKPQPRRAALASAPSSADRRAERAAAANAGANRDSNALPNWKSRLFAQIERYKRYPAEAQSRGDRGVVRLAFSVDRHGGVHDARVVGSSGSHILDRETLAMIERASPLPPPPNDLPGARIAIVVPISYSIR